jgi:hypothetical protein
MVLIGSLETSVSNHLTPRNNTEDGRLDDDVDEVRSSLILASSNPGGKL